MKAFGKILTGAVLLSAVSTLAWAGDDGFAPPQSAPTQRVASADLPAPPPGDMSSSPRGWTPPQPRYSTQTSPTSQPAPQALQQQPQPQQPVAQTRYASQVSPSQSFAPPPDAPQPRYSTQTPSAQPPVSVQRNPAPQQAPVLRYATQTAPPDLAPSRTADAGYRLGAGDKIRIIVYGEDDLGGAFDVDGGGFVRLPLIGQVQAAGLSVHDFEQSVAARLSDGYLRAPRVSAEVTTYRPFYIIGEVNKPGEYAYVNGMNVVNAVALAGGYTYRADDTDIYLRHEGSQREVELPANARTVINPGDIIRVTERFF